MKTDTIHVRLSPIQGLGVLAAKDFSKDEWILEIDDSREVTPERPLRENQGEYHHHRDYLADGKVVYMQWPERHINHSCDPNAYVKVVAETRHVFARREISADQEITYDYCIDSGGDEIWQCNCGSSRCRKTIHSDFFHLPVEYQIEYLPLLSDWFIEENREKVEELKRLVRLQ